MTEKYDVIVIGTGCGGAAAGALAAYYGHKTLILEKNSIVGGRAATYEKAGFKMDHGHILMRCEKGPHGKLLKMVKCRDLIPNFSYALGWGLKNYIADKIMDIPPKRWRISTSFYLFLDMLIYKLKLIDFINFYRFGFSIMLMRKKKVKKFDSIDSKTYLSMYTDNKYFHATFGGITTVGFGARQNQSSAGELIRIVKAGLRDLLNIGYPVNGEGIAAIPKSFLKAAERYGAEIALNTPVDKIIVEDNRVKGVKINGRTIEADIVISNAGIGETVFKLVGENHFDAEYTERIRNLKYSYGGLSLKYALDEPVTDYSWGGEIPENFDKVSLDMSNGIIPDRLPWMYVATSNIDPSLAPKGKQLICVISGGSPAEPELVDWGKWIDKVKQQVREYFPTINDHILFCDESSPDDIARFVGRRYGDAVGVAQTIDQVGDKRPSPVSPVKGLYYTGADVGSSNIATEMATQSAISIAPYLRKKRSLFKAAL